MSNRYLGQLAHTHTHTHRANCSSWANVIGKKQYILRYCPGLLLYQT